MFLPLELILEDVASELPDEIMEELLDDPLEPPLDSYLLMSSFEAVIYHAGLPRRPRAPSAQPPKTYAKIQMQNALVKFNLRVILSQFIFSVKV